MRVSGIRRSERNSLVIFPLSLAVSSHVWRWMCLESCLIRPSLSRLCFDKVCCPWFEPLGSILPTCLLVHYIMPQTRANVGTYMLNSTSTQHVLCRCLYSYSNVVGLVGSTVIPQVVFCLFNQRPAKSEMPVRKNYPYLHQ